MKTNKDGKIGVAEPPKGGPGLVQPPRIDSFTVEPSNMERGQSATLRWAVVNSTDVTIDQGLGAVQATGSRQIFPSATTTYTLTARAATGMDSRAVTVTVVTPPPPPERPKVIPGGTTENPISILGREARDVYFDYDMSELRPDARQALNTNSEVLKRIFAANPAFNVTIEGHADERGSAEYNLGLGDRRATTTRDYLIQLGVPANRLRLISFGEERPACTDQSESCYQMNRRAHLAPAQ